jgi:hypothetical protein
VKNKRHDLNNNDINNRTDLNPHTGSTLVVEPVLRYCFEVCQSPIARSRPTLPARTKEQNDAIVPPGDLVGPHLWPNAPYSAVLVAPASEPYRSRPRQPTITYAQEAKENKQKWVYRQKIDEAKSGNMV